METILRFVPELALLATILVIWKLVAKIKTNSEKKIIQLDLDKIFFERISDSFNENTNEFTVEVRYNGEIVTERARIGKLIGTIFINRFGFWFEDNLAVNRSERLNYEFTYTPSISFLPFVNEPWSIHKNMSDKNVENFLKILNRTENESLTNNDHFLINIKEELSVFEKSIITHYKICNNQSKIAQIKLNYDEKIHYKFAVMDHIVRSKFKISEDLVVQLSDNNDNDYIFAINKLLENRLIEKSRLILSDYKLTKLGVKSHEFGFQEALDYKTKESEKKTLADATLDMRKASITMKNATFVILVTSIISLLAQWENIKLIVLEFFSYSSQGN